MGLNPADQVESFGEVYRLPSSRGLGAVSSPVFRNFARNSPALISDFEIASLELQRLWKLLKVHSIELHAKLLRASAPARTWGRWPAPCRGIEPRKRTRAHVGPLSRTLTG